MKSGGSWGWGLETKSIHIEWPKVLMECMKVTYYQLYYLIKFHHAIVMIMLEGPQFGNSVKRCEDHIIYTCM